MISRIDLPVRSSNLRNWSVSFIQGGHLPLARELSLAFQLMKSIQFSQTLAFNIEETFKPYPSFVARYLSKLGDLDLLEETIQDAMDKSLGLEDQKEAREAYN